MGVVLQAGRGWRLLSWALRDLAPAVGGRADGSTSAAAPRGRVQPACCCSDQGPTGGRAAPPRLPRCVEVIENAASAPPGHLSLCSACKHAPGLDGVLAAAVGQPRAAGASGGVLAGCSQARVRLPGQWWGLVITCWQHRAAVWNEWRPHSMLQQANQAGKPAIKLIAKAPHSVQVGAFLDLRHRPQLSAGLREDRQCCRPSSTPAWRPGRHSGLGCWRPGSLHSSGNGAATAQAARRGPQCRAVL